MPIDYSPFLPLSPVALQILLSLAAEDRHGYGIMQEIKRQSDAQFRIGPGTLYDNLQRLLEQSLVEESKASHGEDPRRRYYRLTTTGRGVLAAETERLASIVRQARMHLNGARPRRHA
jgi:DNA-binding PadR family transcriptional regulator